MCPLQMINDIEALPLTLQATLSTNPPMLKIAKKLTISQRLALCPKFF